MKERVVINCQDCIKNIQNPNSGISVDDLDYDVEQVPETWEELKELCKGISVGLKICSDGTIYCYEYFLAKNRTPAQMWQIIKNLIGEE